MILLTWIVALILAIPTFGVSLAGAVLITMYINRKEQVQAIQVAAITTVALKIDIVNKYHSLRLINGLRSTSYTDSEIFDYTMKSIALTEEVLKKNNRFHDDIDEIIQFAVRLVSYYEDYDNETASTFITKELDKAANYGIKFCLSNNYMLLDSRYN